MWNIFRSRKPLLGVHTQLELFESCIFNFLIRMLLMKNNMFQLNVPQLNKLL